ncbi:hypothetical protein BV898_18379 [Hypsibius exemplaris]|uniref:G-protein coupled receptors family 1 profile domain-containing protein n=1 Tax=Hypsibius exemplaris TaxID=2072580 RepID=A0A9X6NGQ8_HYPEX|nr:hypothetical protein BV898_18379 [Hypsibius exemplaris]
MCFLSLPAIVFLVLAKSNGWYIKDNACAIIHTLYSINLFLVNWADGGLAVNRFVALYFPHHYKAWTTTRVNGAIIGFSWAICIGSALPVTLSMGGQSTSMSALGQCTVTLTGNLGAFLITSGAYFVSAVSGAGSLLILWKCLGVRVRNAGVAPVGGSQRKTTAQRRLSMAKMLLLTFIWTFLCAIPGYVIINSFPFLFRTNPVSTLWIRTSAACQFAFTPCILLTSNTEYQTRAKVLLCGHGVVRPAEGVPRAQTVGSQT